VNHEEQELFRGHVDECAKHLAQRLAEYLPKGSKGLIQAREPMAKFCGVGNDAIVHWLDVRPHLPKGEQWIRLVCFLDLQGYRVIELERTKKSRRGLFELLGYGVLSTADACQMLGYKNPQNLYRVMQGRDGTTDDKDSRMWDIWKLRKDQLEQKKSEARVQYALPWLTARPTRLPVTAGLEDRPSKATALPPKSTAVLHIMEGLVELLDDGAYRGLPLHQLKLLHRTGGATILRLSSHLTDLSAKLMMLEERQRGGKST